LYNENQKEQLVIVCICGEEKLIRLNVDKKQEASASGGFCAEYY
jgi:hypothetical protein